MCLARDVTHFISSHSLEHNMVAARIFGRGSLNGCDTHRLAVVIVHNACYSV